MPDHRHDDNEREIALCLNCRYPDCENGECVAISNLHKGFKRSGGKTPTRYEIGGNTYTVTELMEISGLSESTIRRWIRSGMLHQLKNRIEDWRQANERNSC